MSAIQQSHSLTFMMWFGVENMCPPILQARACRTVLNGDKIRDNNCIGTTFLVVTLHQLTHHHEGMSQTQEKPEAGEPAPGPAEHHKEVCSILILQALLSTAILTNGSSLSR